jgi:hypothetical protein
MAIHANGSSPLNANLERSPGSAWPPSSYQLPSLAHGKALRRQPCAQGPFMRASDVATQRQKQWQQKTLWNGYSQRRPHSNLGSGDGMPEVDRYDRRR